MYDARTAEILNTTWFFIFFCIRVVQNYTTEREKTAMKRETQKEKKD